MFCTKCGSKIDDNAEICMSCGCAVNQAKKKQKKNNPALSVALGIFFFFAIIAGIAGSLEETLKTSSSKSITGDKKCIPLDKATYNSIKVGGSYKQLLKLENYCGEVAVETQIENFASGGMVVFYGKSLGSNANFTVMNGKIVSKAQMGLD